MAIPLSVRKEFFEASKGTIAEKYFDQFVELIRPAISACPYDLEENEYVSSRMGGLPDVPLHWKWPVTDKGPLRFLAQIDLEDIQDSPASARLPQLGMLSFFFGPELYGPSSADDYEIAKVFHFPISGLCRSEHPDSTIVHDAHRLEFEDLWNMPDNKYHLDAVALYEAIPESDHEEFSCTLIDIGEASGAMQILGYPSREQRGFLQLECEALFKRLKNPYNRSLEKQLIQGGRQWELLAQFYLDWREVWPDGNDGYLHYWIRHEDLENSEFSRIAYTWERS